MGVSKNDGFPQQPWVFLLKMIIILGCLGVAPFKETPIYSPNHGDESNGRIRKKSPHKHIQDDGMVVSKKNKWRLPAFSYIPENERISPESIDGWFKD